MERAKKGQRARARRQGQLLNQDGKEAADGGAEALGGGDRAPRLPLGRRARSAEDVMTTGVKEEKKNEGEGENRVEL